MTRAQILTPDQAAQHAARAESSSVPSSGALLFGDDGLARVAEKYRALRPPLTGRELVARRDFAFGDRAISYTQINSTGKAALLEPGSASVEAVSVGGARPEAPFRALGTMLQWDYQEQEALLAARARLPRGEVPDLYEELMLAAMRAVDEALNDICWNGIGSGSGALQGLLASPGAKIPAGISIASGTAATGEQIVNAIMAIITRIGKDSLGTLKPNRVAYNTDSWYYITSATWSASADARTIYSVLQERTPGVQHFHAPELDAPTALGSKPAIMVGCLDRMCAFQGVSGLRPLEIFNEQGGLRYGQVLLFKSSGVILPHPAAYAALTNCDGNT